MRKVSGLLNLATHLRYLFIAVFVMTACTRAQTVDLSTDEAVITELQKMQDAKNSISTGDERLDAKRRAASKLEKKDVCIERLKESAEIIIVGFFRYDYGCHFEGAFVDSQFYEANTLEIHQAALKALGWQEMNQIKREQLSRLWVEKGLLAFFTVLKLKPKGLENADFHPPEAVTTEKGNIKVTLWIQRPPGRTQEKGFQHLEYVFNADSSFSGSSTLKNVITGN